MSSCCGPQRPATSAQVIASTDREGRQARGVIEIALPGGVFTMGNEDERARPEDGEGPVRRVEVSPFRIDALAVTNAEFAAFAADTGYRTTSERLGWSYVFAGHVHPGAYASVLPERPSATPWWAAVAGASWTSPYGPGSSIADRLDHPVVHVSHHDALAYAAWAGRRLPTEAEWEYAARGGLEGARYPWGDELRPGGEHRCNIWQGSFPEHNTAEDGFETTAPARWFEPNGFGLYQCAGNVWEWCADGFDDRQRVIRGGSHLCHVSYCDRYRVAARTGNTPDSSTSHTGFRCAG